MVWSRAVRGAAHEGSSGEAGAALGAATSRWRVDARPGSQRHCCLRGAQGTRKARGAAFGPAAQGVRQPAGAAAQSRRAGTQACASSGLHARVGICTRLKGAALTVRLAAATG